MTFAGVLAGERSWHVEAADVLDGLARLPDECVQTVVTSPPYYGLRDYGVPGQIGLEESPGAFVARLVDVFREVRRVLRPDGTLWLNLGDTYATGAGKVGASPGGGAQGKRWLGQPESHRLGPATQPNRMPLPGLKPKDLIGMPWRVAFALQEDGWILRSDIIWHKPNPMPESVRDRPTKAHEYLFLFSKSPGYYYDAQAVREPLARPDLAGKKRRVGPTAERPVGERNDQGRVVPYAGPDAKRNRRSVWTVPSRPFKGAHFATFPPALVTPCVLAGTSDLGACADCGTPWSRVVERKRYGSYHDHEADLERGMSQPSPRKLGGSEFLKHHSPPTTVGWRPGCDCGMVAKTRPCVVLDPFAGAATTGVVALEHGRRFLGVELNVRYVEDIARPRLEAVAKGVRA